MLYNSLTFVSIILLLSLQSSGDLENNENVAGVITKMLQTAAKVPISGDRTQTFKRMSGGLLIVLGLFYLATLLLS